jgi:HAD superfamily hydrolase (TIGR01549 family)
MTIKAVMFDAFGTLLKIQNGVHPFRQIFQRGRQQGRRPQPDDAHTLMTRRLGLAEAADYFEIKVSTEDLQNIQAQLDEELAGIQAYPDAIDAVNLLKDADVRVAVCSNLAMPYGAAVRRLFPQMDAYGFSYELGWAKPDPEIYFATCRMLGMQLTSHDGVSQTVMVGDSLRCDRDGPQAVGISGFFLDRSGKTGFSNLLEFAQFVIAGNRD